MLRLGPLAWLDCVTVVFPSLCYVVLPPSGSRPLPSGGLYNGEAATDLSLTPGELVSVDKTKLDAGKRRLLFVSH